VRQLRPPRPYRDVDPDPAVFRRGADVRLQLNSPELQRQPPEDVALLPSGLARPAAPYAGLLGHLDLEHFGRIEAVHGDIFAAQAEAVVLPMTPNLMPYRGLGLEAYDRGGKELVSETFIKAMPKKEKEPGGGGGSEKNTEEKAQEVLHVGSTVTVSGRGVAADKIMFVIMPWFWQGSPLDAAKRLRYCVRCALQAASSQGLESIALPSLGGGVFGYEPRQCSSIFLDEAVESLLQIEASDPSYTLKRITFVDSHPETAEAFGAALTDAAYRWLPERRLTTAPQFWGQATRRLLVLPDAPNFFLKRWRIKFKQRHGVKRRVRKHYLSNWIPWLWRAQKVAQPPPLLVHARSGDVAAQDRQLPARPYFFRGVSHWLFPSRRSGFNLLRRTSSGHWKGVLRQFRLVDAVRPRA